MFCFALGIAGSFVTIEMKLVSMFSALECRYYYIMFQTFLLNTSVTSESVEHLHGSAVRIGLHFESVETR